MTPREILILSLSKDEGVMVRQVHHEDVSFPPTLALPRKGEGDSNIFTLPLEGGGRGRGDHAASNGVAP
jgi:hypothetical protein